MLFLTPAFACIVAGFAAVQAKAFSECFGWLRTLFCLMVAVAAGKTSLLSRFPLLLLVVALSVIYAAFLG